MLELLVGALGTGVVLFTLTNIDDLFLLVGFFAERGVAARDVALGQCAGMAALVAVSVIAARISLLLPMPYVGLLGLIPIALGVRKLAESRDADDDASVHANKGTRWSTIAAVAAVTVANGGDNIGVYIPVFAMRSAAEVWLIVLVFAFMTVLWCLACHWLVNHRTIGTSVRRVGHALLPYALIAVGVWVLVEAHSYSLLPGG